MVTKSLAAVTTELRRRKGNIPSSGVENCRPKRINGVLRPDKGYSEHAYGNAEDLKINGANAQKPYVDELARMKREGFPVGLVLHAAVRADHTDHIHVEGYPSLSKAGKTPPCAGGKSITDVGEVFGGIKAGVSGITSLTPGSTTGGFQTINLPLLGDLGISWGQIVFTLIGLAVAIALVLFLMQGFKGQAVEAITKGVL